MRPRHIKASFVSESTKKEIEEPEDEKEKKNHKSSYAAREALETRDRTNRQKITGEYIRTNTYTHICASRCTKEHQSPRKEQRRDALVFFIKFSRSQGEKYNKYIAASSVLLMMWYTTSDTQQVTKKKTKKNHGDGPAQTHSLEA